MEDFAEIYSTYYDTVFQFVRSLCRDDAWAEEITQTAFCKALQHMDAFRGECKWSVWLCQIAKNTFYTEAKKRNRQVEYPLEILPDAQDSAQEVQDKETAQALHRLLHELGEPYKEVFWMRTFGELSFAEIASIWNRSESWARVTYYRAKMKLKEGVQ